MHSSGCDKNTVSVRDFIRAGPTSGFDMLSPCRRTLRNGLEELSEGGVGMNITAGLHIVTQYVYGLYISDPAVNILCFVVAIFRTNKILGTDVLKQSQKMFVQNF